MSQTTTDHDTIRQWAERHGGKPAAVSRTHDDGDVGIIRIMFPKAPHSDHQALTEISWDEFFEEFDARGLALVYDDGTLFSKLVRRDGSDDHRHGGTDDQAHDAQGRPPARGSSRGRPGGTRTH